MMEHVPPPGSLVLIVALSARAIAASAVRAGYRPVTVDFFADDDTRALALQSVRYPGRWTCGFGRRHLFPTVAQILTDLPTPPAALVVGAGFEDRPRLLSKLADAVPLYGCTPEVVAAVKDPFGLSEQLRRLDVPHPDTRRIVPEEGKWLSRRRGASGGMHIGPARPGSVGPGRYAQARLDGTSVSALVLTDGERSRLLAFSKQWADPTPQTPFRFAGVVGPIELPADVRASVALAASRICPAFGLKGLVSLDLIVNDDRWWLLEINPRIGASIDALDDAEGSLFRAHLHASGGIHTDCRVSDATIRATMVVYARTDTRAPERSWWPEWTLDRPTPGDDLNEGAPVVTVTATARTAEEAEGIVRERASEIAKALRETLT